MSDPRLFTLDGPDAAGSPAPPPRADAPPDERVAALSPPAEGPPDYPPEPPTGTALIEPAEPVEPVEPPPEQSSELPRPDLLAGLNPVQLEAVTHTDGPLLIVA